MSKRSIKPKIFVDSVIEIDHEEEPVKRRKNASKKKGGNESDDSFQYGGEIRKNRADKKAEKQKEKEAKKADVNNPAPEI